MNTTINVVQILWHVFLLLSFNKNANFVQYVDMNSRRGKTVIENNSGRGPYSREYGSRHIKVYICWLLCFYPVKLVTHRGTEAPKNSFQQRQTETGTDRSKTSNFNKRRYHNITVDKLILTELVQRIIFICRCNTNR